MKKFKGMSPATVKRLKRLIEEREVKWSKNRMNQDEASYGPEFVTVWYSLELSDGKMGYIGMAAGEVVTKKYKTKDACKKAVEKYLKGKK